MVEATAGVNQQVQAQSPGFFQTGYDLLDGALNSYFALQTAKETTKLQVAAQQQADARNIPSVTTQAGADPSLFAQYTTGTKGKLLKEGLIVLAVVGVLGFVVVKL